MSFSFVEIWLAIGVICILIEFTHLPGIGVLFLGLGAISTSLIISYTPQMWYYQIIYFGITSFFWFLLLWWPLKHFSKNKMYNTKGKAYFDIIGMSVKVAFQDIKPGQDGQVHWSGTIMNARLQDKETSAKSGDELYVTDVKGNILICSTKKP
jgi:membrane protein implicated in regulation of membrane protease activity